ncbi:MAG: hypothetical protein LBJ94_02285 [Puniceicoccales bacterium]|jgi:hypothetical protein|nr:hypothetical protein [Puniceicoccales bacterium]
MNAVNDIRALYAKAMKTGRATTATIKVSGQECLVEVSPSKDDQQRMHVSILHAPLGMRECNQAEFIYDEEHIGEQLEKFSEKITELEINAMCEKTLSTGESQKSNLIVNGQECEVKVSLGENQQVYVSILYVPLGVRQCQCQTEFIYDGEHTGEQIGRFSEEITRAEINAMYEKTISTGEDQRNNLIVSGQEYEIRIGPGGHQQAYVSILHAPPGSQEGQQVCEFIYKRGESLAEHIAEASKEASKIDDLERVIAPVANCFNQPMPQREADVQIKQIGTMLEDLRAFVQGHEFSDVEMNFLIKKLGQLGGKNMILWSNGNSSTDVSHIAWQIEGLQLLLDAKENGIDGAAAPIIERFHQSIAEKEVDVRMGEIGTILENMRTFVRQNLVSEAGMSILKIMLDRLAGNGDMIQGSNGNSSINECDNPACRSIALQIEGLKLLLDTKANGIDDTFAPIIERLHQSISEDQLNAQMGQLGTILEDLKIFVQGNDLSKNGIAATLRKVIVQLGGNGSTVQLASGNFSINECDNPACRKMAWQIEELQVLLDARANGQVNLEISVSPPIKILNGASHSTLQLAHRGKGGQEPMLLKPCGKKNDFGVETGGYGRNLATSELQDMFVKVGASLGMAVPHVVASVSAAEANGEAYIAMEYLEGATVSGSVGRKQLLYNNEFIRCETWLQLMDILTGQMDRRGDNVMYIENSPIGIDHDFSFPTDPPQKFAGSIPDQLARKIGKHEWADRNYGMPPIIDRQMRDVIGALDLKELEAMYRKCGLTKLELSAAMSRARELKSRVKALSRSQIIAPSAWEANQGRLTDTNSYAARHSAGD